MKTNKFKLGSLIMSDHINLFIITHIDEIEDDAIAFGFKNNSIEHISIKWLNKQINESSWVELLSY